MSYMNYEEVNDRSGKLAKDKDDTFYRSDYGGERIIFHIDANSAFLSWEAVYRLQHGESEDIREKAAVIGGDPKSRHGIVLAKSIKAKAYGVKTGESLMEARMKCPGLLVVPPRSHVYLKSSNAMYEIFKEFTPTIQRYSIDECFLDMTFNRDAREDAYKAAVKIKERIKKELGFTVSIGVANNKLLAKMGSEIKKPDAVTTLYPYEIEEKLWPLPVRELFMVGGATEKKLKRIGIYTIGELAKTEECIIRTLLKSHGGLVWRYANGIDDSSVRKENYINMKGIGNSTTTSFDIDSTKEAHMVLLSLVETTTMRLRDSGNICGIVTVHIRNNKFMNYSHRRKLSVRSNNTDYIYKEAVEIFNEMWCGDDIRHLGVRLSDLTTDENRQLSLIDYENFEKKERFDSVVDELRIKYGKSSLIRANFLHSGIKAINGGAGSESYPIMSSIL